MPIRAEVSPPPLPPRVADRDPAARSEACPPAMRTLQKTAPRLDLHLHLEEPRPQFSGAWRYHMIWIKEGAKVRRNQDGHPCSPLHARWM
jgi:hypothetical protein